MQNDSLMCPADGKCWPRGLCSSPHGLILHSLAHSYSHGILKFLGQQESPSSNVQVPFKRLCTSCLFANVLLVWANHMSNPDSKGRETDTTSDAMSCKVTLQERQYKEGKPYGFFAVYHRSTPATNYSRSSHMQGMPTPLPGHPKFSSNYSSGFEVQDLMT